MPEPEIRTCTRCRRAQSVDAFDGDGVQCRTCRERLRAQNRAWRLANPERVRAQKRAWAESNPEKVRASVRAWTTVHPDRVRETARNRRHRAKIEAIAAYGGHCECCGETELAFLTLDHVDGRGTALRQAAFYLWLKAHGWPATPRLRVLCWNCNCGRQANGGLCPHQVNERKWNHA